MAVLHAVRDEKHEGQRVRRGGAIADRNDLGVDVVEDVFDMRAARANRKCVGGRVGGDPVIGVERGGEHAVVAGVEQAAEARRARARIVVDRAGDRIGVAGEIGGEIDEGVGVGDEGIDAHAILIGQRLRLLRLAHQRGDAGAHRVDAQLDVVGARRVVALDSR